jgi:diguanylate cyclase (GGDEF)-like protein
MQWMQGYPFYLLIGAAFGIYLTYLSYPYRNTPGRRYFWIVMLLGSVTVFTTVLELMTSSFMIKLWWRNVQQIPLFLTGLFIYALAKDYVGRIPNGLPRRQLFLLLIPIVGYILLIFTDQYHHLMRSSVGLETMGTLSGITVKPTLLSMTLIVCNQVLCLFAVFILIVHLRNTPKYYYKQHILLIIGLVVPITLSLLLPVLNIKILGFSALTFFPTGGIIYYAILRFGMLSIWPIAKDKIYVNMKDGIVLTDRYDTIADLNPSAERMLKTLSGTSEAGRIGQPITHSLFNQPQLLSSYINKQETTVELTMAVNGEGDLCYEITLIPIGTPDSLNTGMLLIISDYSDKKRYERELIVQATIDELTGLFNRRHFLRLVCNRLTRAEDRISLLLIDIDNFKSINDRYGHLAGDQALIAFSDQLRNLFKANGIVGRVGGEEFAVCLSGLSEEKSMQEAEKFRHLMEASPIELRGDLVISMTASIGVVYTNRSGDTFEELYQQADSALYLSKETGKNKVTLGGLVQKYQ